MILNSEVSKHMHVTPTITRANVIARVEDDLFNPGLCINI